MHLSICGWTHQLKWKDGYGHLAAAAAKSLQSCPTLCDPIDGSPPGSPVPGILQARILKWVAISFSNAWKWKVKVKSLSRVRLLATPWTAAHQAPPSMGFSRQEYWSGVPLPSQHWLKQPYEPTMIHVGQLVSFTQQIHNYAQHCAKVWAQRWLEPGLYLQGSLCLAGKQSKSQQQLNSI